MSATIAAESAGKLAKWLHARLFITAFRPVPLTLHLKVRSLLFFLFSIFVSRENVSSLN